MILRVVFMSIMEGELFTCAVFDTNVVYCWNRMVNLHVIDKYLRSGHDYAKKFVMDENVSLEIIINSLMYAWEKSLAGCFTAYVYMLEERGWIVECKKIKYTDARELSFGLPGEKQYEHAIIKRREEFEAMFGKSSRSVLGKIKKFFKIIY